MRNEIKAIIFIGIVSFLAFLPFFAFGFMSENFDTYNTGTLSGQGDWLGSDGIIVTDEHSYSGVNSVSASTTSQYATTSIATITTNKSREIKAMVRPTDFYNLFLAVDSTQNDDYMQCSLSFVNQTNNHYLTVAFQHGSMSGSSGCGFADTKVNDWDYTLEMIFPKDGSAYCKATKISTGGTCTYSPGYNFNINNSLDTLRIMTPSFLSGTASHLDDITDNYWEESWELDWPTTDSWVYPLTKNQCLSYDASKTYGSSTWEFHKILQVNNPDEFRYLHIDLIKDGSVVGATTWDLYFAKTALCGGLNTCQLDLMSWKAWPSLDITDGTYRLEFNLCNDLAETDCMNQQYKNVLWYVILGEGLVAQSKVSCSANVWPLPDYRVVYDSEDEDEWYDWLYRHTAGRVGDFIDKWYNNFKERFPFSWLFYFYETTVETINEYSGDTGTSTAVGFSVGWTMPTSSAVMAGQSFTVVDFEEASDRWGEHFTIFRRIFIFVLYLGLVTTIFYQTKRFLLTLSEED